MMKSSTLFERGPLPPFVHLMSTRRHLHDRCSQAFPVFHAFPLPCIILNENRRTKNGGGLRTRLSSTPFGRNMQLQLICNLIHVLLGKDVTLNHSKRGGPLQMNPEYN